jgi:hypothetical protein
MHNLYQEVSPDVFANNRVSMALDTGKKFEEVKDRWGYLISISLGFGSHPMFAVVQHVTVGQQALPAMPGIREFICTSKFM